jgi:hypothetical protein
MIEARIEILHNQSNKLRGWLYTFRNSPVYMLSAGYLQRFIENNNVQIADLRRQHEEVSNYLNNTGIYANSARQASLLTKAAGALSAVSYTAKTGGFNLSGIKDWTWNDPELIECYWCAHNRVTLEQYLVFDDALNPVAPTPELLALLGRLGPYLLDKDMTIDELFGTLSNQERYVLFYTALWLHNLFYNTGREVFQANLIGVNVSWALYDALRPFLPEQVSLGPVTEYFSFMINGEVFTALDQSGSIQMRSGFMDVYDPSVALLGMDIDTKIVVFKSGDKEYRLQLWDGTYGWKGFIGGEGALYFRDASAADALPYTPDKDLSTEGLKEKLPAMTTDEMNNYFIGYEVLPEGEQLPMVLEIYTQGGEKLFTNRTSDYANGGDHYWNFGTVPNHRLKLEKEDVYTHFEITIEDPVLRGDLLAALHDTDIEVATNGDVVELTWGEK